MSETVDLFLTGTTLPGFHVATVAPALATMLRISEERALVLLSGKATAIKRQLMHSEAGRYLQALHRVGAAAEVRTIAAADGAFPSLLPAEAVAPVVPRRPPPAAPPPPLPASLPALDAAPPAAADPWAVLSSTITPLPLDVVVAPELVVPPPLESYDFAAPSLPQMARPVAPVAPPLAAPGLTLLEEVEDVVCPACDLSQPKRTLCRGCGADMPRLRLIKDGAVREAHAQLRIEMLPNGPLTRASRALEDNGTALFAFNMQGRIGRLRFLAWQWVAVVPLLMMGLLAAASFSVGGSVFLMLIAGLLSIFMWLRTAVLRLHDFGLGGIWILVPTVAGGAASAMYGGSTMMYAMMFLGLLNLAMVLMPGSSEANEYGDPPAPNNILVVLAAVALVATSAGSYSIKKPQLSQEPQGQQEHSEPRDNADSSREQWRDERSSP